MNKDFDLIILGGGPGGYVAGIRAAQLGLNVAVVEKENLGGICLNWGCIPTKALLRSAEIYDLVKNATEFGIECSNVKPNFSKIIKRSRNVAEKLSSGVKHLLKKNNVTVINGKGKLSNKKTIVITTNNGEKKEISYNNLVIATGARARILPNLKPDGKFIWTYKEAIKPNSLPKSILIVGSGAIGIEFASFYNMLGSKVTVIELSERILNAEDHEVSEYAHKEFEKRGIKVLPSTKIQKIEKKTNKVVVQLDTKGKIHEESFEKIISAVGIVPNIEDIGLENTKIQLADNKHIKTDQFMETDEKGIYAIGDVTSPPWLAHKASHEAVICVEKIAGLNPHPINNNNIPACTYCYPQIASVGYTEERAKKEKLDIKVGKFPFIGNGKATAMGEETGFIKTIFDSNTGELLGAHMIGAEVTEMIQGFVISKNLETTEEDLINSIFPHPTLSESMHEAVLAAFKRQLHI